MDDVRGFHPTPYAAHLKCILANGYCCYTLNKLDALFNGILETPRLLVAPSLHSGHYSLGLSGF